MKRKLVKAFRELHKIGIKNVWDFTWSTGVALPVWTCNRDVKRQDERQTIPTADVNEC